MYQSLLDRESAGVDPFRWFLAQHRSPEHAIIAAASHEESPTVRLVRSFIERNRPQREAAAALDDAARQLREPVAPPLRLEDRVRERAVAQRAEQAAANERLAVALEGVRDAMLARPRMTPGNWIALAGVAVAIVAVIVGH
jgi:hypothetical protein